MSRKKLSGSLAILAMLPAKVLAKPEQILYGPPPTIGLTRTEAAILLAKIFAIPVILFIGIVIVLVARAKKGGKK